MHYYETPTNLRFVLLTDTGTMSMRNVLHQIYINLWVEYGTSVLLGAWVTTRRVSKKKKEGVLQQKLTFANSGQESPRASRAQGRRGRPERALRGRPGPVHQGSAMMSSRFFDCTHTQSSHRRPARPPRPSKITRDPSAPLPGRPYRLSIPMHAQKDQVVFGSKSHPSMDLCKAAKSHETRDGTTVAEPPCTSWRPINQTRPRYTYIYPRERTTSGTTQTGLGCVEITRRIGLERLQKLTSSIRERSGEARSHSNNSAHTSGNLAPFGGPRSRLFGGPRDVNTCLPDLGRVVD